LRDDHVERIQIRKVPDVAKCRLALNPGGSGFPVFALHGQQNSKIHKASDAFDYLLFPGIKLTRNGEAAKLMPERNATILTCAGFGVRANVTPRYAFN
jgi:hypothetical protein